MRSTLPLAAALLAAASLVSPGAGASIIIDLESVPPSLTVVRGQDYVLRMRVTNRSDAGETFGAVPGADSTGSGFTLIDAVFPGQGITPLFGSFATILSPGDSLELDLVRLGGDRGALGPLPLGTFDRSVAMGVFSCDSVSGICTSGPPSAVAEFTLTVIPEPQTAVLLALGLALAGSAGLARRVRGRGTERR